MNEELDKIILELYNKLDFKLSEKEKQLIHFKSVSNFIRHLIIHQHYNPTENKKLQNFGEIRMKKLLLEYLNLVTKKEVSEELAIKYYKDYINVIGKFMSQYYNFTGSGKSEIIHFIIVFLLGLGADFFLHLFFEVEILTLFTPTLLFLAFIRVGFKHKKRKVYGLLY